MTIQALSSVGNAVNYAKDSFKNIGKNIEIVKNAKKNLEPYVEKRVAANMETNANEIFKFCKSEKRYNKIYEKIASKATQDFQGFVKNSKKQLGVAAGIVVAGIAAIAIGVKAIKSHNAKKMEAKNDLNTTNV